MAVPPSMARSSPTSSAPINTQPASALGIIIVPSLRVPAYGFGESVLHGHPGGWFPDEAGSACYHPLVRLYVGPRRVGCSICGIHTRSERSGRRTLHGTL